MARRYKYKLSKLRDLSWENWDPIGLKNGRVNCEDEHDSYLLRVIGMFTEDVPQSEIVEYLIKIECEHMGLGVNSTARPRAEQLVAAIVGYQQTL